MMNILTIQTQANGWWQGRIENLEFCVVLQNLMWDPSTCSDFYDESAWNERG